MKNHSYKRQLLIYFTTVFTAFAVFLISFQLYSDRENKKETLMYRLSVYADIIAGTDDCSEIASSLPENLRITVMDITGSVVYDSSEEESMLDNHIERPEISEALKNGEGKSIRLSSTVGIQYFYYAKSYGDKIIRVALPFKYEVRQFLRPDTVFILVITMVFLTALFLLMFLADKFGDGVGKLHRLAEDAGNGRIDYNADFPDSELGDIGQQIVKGYRELEHSNKIIALEKEKNKMVKHQMTNNIAHELRTPVSSIRGYLETLISCKDISEEKRDMFIERAYTQVIRLSDLIRDISIITKIEEAPELLTKEKIYPKTVVDEITEEFNAEISGKEITVENEIDPELTVCGNQTLIYAIFRNLFENSLKYAGNGIAIHTECNPDTDDHCRFSYYDTGCGVPEEHLNRIFERFYRVSEGRSRSTGGSGLGLSIVRNAIAFHKGEITAFNRKTGGLEFVFTIKVRVEVE